jgi:hypothetical protein
MNIPKTTRGDFNEESIVDEKTLEIINYCKLIKE